MFSSPALERGTFASFVHWLWEEEEDVEGDEGS